MHISTELNCAAHIKITYIFYHYCKIKVASSAFVTLNEHYASEASVYKQVQSASGHRGGVRTVLFTSKPFNSSFFALRIIDEKNVLFTVCGYFFFFRFFLLLSYLIVYKLYKCVIVQLKQLCVLFGYMELLLWLMQILFKCIF